MASKLPMREKANQPFEAGRGYLPLFVGLIALGVVCALSLFFFSIGGRSFRVKSGHSAPEVIRAVPEAREGVPEFDFGGVLAPQNFGARQGFTRPLRLDPPFEPITSKSFKNDDFRIMLGGVEGPDMEGVCKGANDELWACGLEARAALHALLRGKMVFCESYAPGGKIDQLGKGLVPATCRFEEKILAVEMVRTGFVRPAGLQDRAILAAEEEARAAGRGLWRGGWRVVR